MKSVFKKWGTLLTSLLVATTLISSAGAQQIDKRRLPSQVPNARDQATNIISEAGGLGAITPTTATLLIAAESGTADNLDNVVVTAWNVGDTLKVKADAGDTITLKHGTGNITTDTGLDFDLTDEAYVWLDVTASGVTLRRGGGASETITSLSALGALTSSSPAGAVRFIGAGGRSGAFVRTTDDISALVTADPENCVSYPDPAEPDGSSGGWVLQNWLDYPKVVKVEWCGAIGDGDSANKTTNATAIDAAIDLVEADINGGPGGTVQFTGHYIVASGLTVDAEGVTLEGIANRELWYPSSWTDSASTLEFDHASGDAIRVYFSSSAIKRLRIDATATRRAGSTAATSNGIRYEAADEDDANRRVNFPVIEDVQVIRQPGSGVALIGETVGAYFTRLTATDNRRHGLVIDRGDETGRTNLTQGGANIRPGIVTIVNPRLSDNDGHGLKIGSSSSGVYTPYRVSVLNMESFRNALETTGGREGTFDAWVHGENVEIKQSAVSGVDNSATANVNDGLYVAGRNIDLWNNRYISTDVPVTFGYISGGIGNDGLNLWGGLIVGGTTRDNAVVIESGGIGDCFIYLPVASGVTNVTSTSSNCSNYSTLGSGGISDPIDVNDFSDDDLDLNATDTNLSGQLVISQFSTGDAGLRIGINGGQYYIFGVDNSQSDMFGIQANTGLNSSATFQMNTSGEIGLGGTPTAAYAVTSHGAVIAPSIRSKGSAFTANDDAVATLAFTGNTGDVYGVAVIAGNVAAAEPSIVAFRAGSANAFCAVISGNITCGTPQADPPTGTTGADGDSTVYLSTDSADMWIENRSGGSRTWIPTFLSLSSGYLTQ